MSPPEPTVPGSDRVRLAESALEAAMSVDGVTGAHAGSVGLLQTISGSSRFAGVRVVAHVEGRYSVELGLRARMVPLNPLAGAVRDRVGQRATRDGLRERLGPVSVTFFDLGESDAGEDA